MFKCITNRIYLNHFCFFAIILVILQNGLAFKDNTYDWENFDMQMEGNQPSFNSSSSTSNIRNIYNGNQVDGDSSNANGNEDNDNDDGIIDDQRQSENIVATTSVAIDETIPTESEIIETKSYYLANEQHMPNQQYNHHHNKNNHHHHHHHNHHYQKKLQQQQHRHHTEHMNNNHHFSSSTYRYDSPSQRKSSSSIRQAANSNRMNKGKHLMPDIMNVDRIMHGQLTYKQKENTYKHYRNAEKYNSYGFISPKSNTIRCSHKQSNTNQNPYQLSDQKYYNGKEKKSRYDDAAVLMMTVDCTTIDSSPPSHSKHSSSVSHRADNYIPPYLRKLNRRYKQLYNLMEGIVPADNEKTLQQPIEHNLLSHSIKDNKWLEANLFEEQREQNDQPVIAPRIDESSTRKEVSLLSSNSGRNINSDEMNEIPEDRYSDRTSDGLYKVSPKSKIFMYHRVMSSNSGNNVGGGKSGRKQRLPFVAITNKRLQPSTSSAATISHKNNQMDIQQNIFPMP